MKWFKKLVAEWAEQGINYAEVATTKAGRVVSNNDYASPSDEPILNFKIYSAVGGKIAEFRRYDRKSDRSDCTTYIITDEQDFGECISRIATMEKLKL
jgi:hypothetical protein